jgi:hypothetical protein
VLILRALPRKDNKTAGVATSFILINQRRFNNLALALAKAVGTAFTIIVARKFKPFKEGRGQVTENTSTAYLFKNNH